MGRSRLRALSWIVGVAGLLVIGVAALVISFKQPKSWNVLLITVDTLRADHLGAYGYARNTSPNLDQFARQSSLFRQAYAHAPETVPSLGSLMTSHYPHETKLYSNENVLADEAVTLAELLRDAGYVTGAIVGNGVLVRGGGLEQGFQEYDDHMDDKVSMGLERKAPVVTQAAIAWLERRHREKFFLWIHYMDPHGPYIAPPPYDTMFVEPAKDSEKRIPVNEARTGRGGIPDYQQLGGHREVAYYIAQYDGEIRYLDHWLGELLGAVRRLELLENTVIIFTADHGEGMGEHDYYFAHNEFLYEGLIRVPLLLRFPVTSAGGKDVAIPVAQVDVLPTILGLLSLHAPGPVNGKALTEPYQAGTVYAESFANGPKQALIENRLKLITQEDGYELFDLEHDPAESTNVVSGDMSPTEMAKANVLREQLERLGRHDLLALGPPISRRGDRAFEGKLRSLGYVQ